MTGGRGPFTLDLARKFHESGHPVYVADSVSYSVSRFSWSVCKHFTLPPPKADDEVYLQALSDIVRRYGIDLLIPTCEELFYIARKLHVVKFPCRVLVDKFEKLDQLHDKYRFIELVDSCGLPVPYTRKAETREELVRVLRRWEKNGPVVIKPVYSRFGANLVVLGNSRTEILPTRIEDPPWVVQQYVDGDQYCTYSVCQRGRLLAHVTYMTPYTTVGNSDYRAGYRGAGIYFISTWDQEIEQWVRKFVDRMQFTGQIAFDLIRRKDGALLPIECNPRLTSGIHLFANDTSICDAFTGVPQRTVMAQPGTRRMISHGIWLHSLSHLRSWRALSKCITDFVGAKDVLFSWHDLLPYFHGTWILLYLFWKSWKSGTHFADTVTRDISWNGSKNSL